MLTMAIHPGGVRASLAAKQAEHLSIISGATHSIALVSVLLLFLGACGLSWRIAAADRISFAAIVTFGFASVAVLVAAAVSGFIFPSIMKAMARDVPAAADQWQIVLHSVGQINQSFGRISSVAASIAIILWSVSALRNGGFGRGVAIYGCIVSALIILWICVGRSRLDVHAMTVIALGQAIWFILVGSQLCSGRASCIQAQ
jgi:hypothetical protein